MVIFRNRNVAREWKRLGNNGLKNLLFGITEIFQKRLAILDSGVLSSSIRESLYGFPFELRVRNEQILSLPSANIWRLV